MTELFKSKFSTGVLSHLLSAVLLVTIIILNLGTIGKIFKRKLLG